jgi:putative (di)nucleoside polyphosphate hydrolase
MAATSTYAASSHGKTSHMKDARDLLLADLEHFGEALFRNEEIGEKRFSFFVTLVTAVAGGLVALATTDVGPTPDVTIRVSRAAVAFLLVVGILTYLRLLQRNRVTDEYQRTMQYIRRHLSVGVPELATYAVPVSAATRRSSRYWNLLKAGYAPTVAVINGILAALLVYLLMPADPWWPYAAGSAVLVLLLVPTSRRQKGLATTTETFRAGVGAAIIDGTGRILALERADVPGAWQLPQGGLELGEEPEDALYREVSEETGILPHNLSLLDTYPGPLAYELPREHRSPKTGRGQVQYWFLLRLAPTHEPLDLRKSGEFRAWRWCRFDEVAEAAAGFRKPVYAALRDRFRDHLA